MNESLADRDALRAHYGSVSRTASGKEMDRIDRHGRRFIELSPFVVMATADAEGRCDASPKGDSPGFVKVLDERTLLIPDRPGNNRVDSLQNIVANPRIGLIFFLPGYNETFRANGTARISTEPDLLEATAHAGKQPRSVIVVSVEEAFMHCGKALIRSKLWDPEQHIEKGQFPSLARILADQIEGVEEKATEARIEDAYERQLY